MANLVTFSRLLLLLAVVVLAYRTGEPSLQILAAPLLAIAFLTDALDGYIARKRDETSTFGAVFDIAVDRIVEVTMWIVLTDLDLVPLWVPLLFVARGAIVDSIRAHQVGVESRSPFDLLRSPWGRFLVKGRVVRFVYAAVKALTFCWLLVLLPLPELDPARWASAGASLLTVGDALIYLSAVLCLARGLPVILEFLLEQGRLRRSALPEPGRAGVE